MSDEIQPLAFPVSKACKRAGLGETRFRDAIKRGELEVIKIGGVTLVEDSEIARWLASKRKREVPA